MAAPPRAHTSEAYARVERLLAEDRCVILDGAVATELQRTHDLHGENAAPGGDLWGTWALYKAPEAVLDVHRSYVDIGCDVISTDTWSILSAPEMEMRSSPGSAEVLHWMDVARLGIRLAREAVRDGGRDGQCAVAFAISEEVNSAGRRGTLDLLARVFDEQPPDLIMLETLTLIRDPLTYETIESLLATGLPVWVSFRRCRHGVCGVYGQHWGPPEGDLFGRAARRFEEMGVGALLINCLPVDHITGILPWLRDFTDMPLGVYPNLGYLSSSRWRFDERIGPDEYAALALEWREEGAQIVGGCCGTTPDHIAAAAAALEGTKPGRGKARENGHDRAVELARIVPETPPKPWLDERGRTLFPLPFPELMVDPGVFVPTQGSYLVWKHLFRTGAGEGLTCLDVGCGCGILSVQLGLNGARRVHAIDIDRNAVANTLANGFRNGVAAQMTGEDVDLYQWEPAERFELVVASLYQMPVDPYEEPSGHRPLDYWGRSLLDHFVALLPSLLAQGGRALFMQLSVVGQQRTAELLEKAGFTSRVVDYAFFPFGPLFESNEEQIARVEQLSDAFHLTPGGDDVMVAYLLEVSTG